MKPRVGILTTFTGVDQAYSLVNVVHTQIEMLLAGGYAPVLFASSLFPQPEGFWSGRQFEVRRLAHPDAGWEDIYTILAEKSADIDVMLCHDIVFLSQHREWGKALQKLAGEERRPLAYLHWQHSRGDGMLEKIEKSWYCYPNRGDLEHVAKINQTDLERVRYVPHPLDFTYLGWPELAIQIAEDTGFPFADISVLLPTRMDRQKQVDKAIRLMAGLQRAGRRVSMLIADSFATGDRFVKYREDLKMLAYDLGLGDCVHFLSEDYEECYISTPRPVIKALLEMSNLFIQPSNSETSSLVVMEAALAGALPVINEDFPAIHHLYEHALRLPFGSIINNTQYYRHIKMPDGSEKKVEDAQLFWDDQARDVVLPACDREAGALVKRQQFRDRWPGRVFADHLEPLILETWHSGGGSEQALSGDLAITAIVTSLDNLPLLKRQLAVLPYEVGRVIVVDNGSIDGTYEYLEGLHYDWLEVIHKDNRGAGPGRNAGLALWDNRTEYTLMLDGGIMPPIGGAKMLKSYLERHPEAQVISPEVATCFTTEAEEATLIAPELPEDPQCFWQRCLSSTAYCLCHAAAWVVRFSEEGPFGEPGWGVDDNDMAYRWDAHDPPIIHHEFTYEMSGWKLYRRRGGSFQRLFEETGIYPNQYGSVYEKRNIKCLHDWRLLHGLLYGRSSMPSFSYVIQDVPMPEFARLVKRLHDGDRDCEVVVQDDSDPEIKWWLDTFALRWSHGNTTIDPDGNILHRGVEYPEELWSGDVVRDRGPLAEPMIITPENMGEYLDLAAA